VENNALLFSIEKQVCWSQYPNPQTPGLTADSGGLYHAAVMVPVQAANISRGLTAIEPIRRILSGLKSESQLKKVACLL